MKKHLLFICLLFCGLVSQATVHTITVANFQFSDRTSNSITTNAVVGDTITWTWVSGTHTTTCDPVNHSNTSLPAGAAAWNSPMTSAVTSFSYIPKVVGTYSYICIPHADFGMIGTINVSSILPVTFLSFGATAGQGNQALLKWVVASEVNVSYYSVQKSTDGRTFTEAGRVPASDNSSLQKTYTFSDNTATNSRYVYYSLKIVDKDGKTQSSSIALFKNVAAKGDIIISMSPNPINSPGHLMLQFNADKPGTMLVQLFDMNGKLVKQTNMMAAAGVNNGHFHLGELPSGNYKVIFSIDGKKETKQLQFK